MNTIRRLGAMAALCAPFTLAAQSAPQYTPEQAQANLDRFCSPESLKTRAGHYQCLQESSGQALSFAGQFHALLFTKVGVSPKPENFREMADRWDKISIVHEDVPDSYRVRTYHQNCYDLLQMNIMDPASPLEFAFTTGYGLPKGCVDEAVRMSRTYNLPLDFKEAARLQAHFDRIYKYYAANPVIPPAPEPPLRLNG